VVTGLGLVLLTGWKPFVATALEQPLPVELAKPAELITQLESLEDHVRSTEHYTGRPG
jgi:hypothetical protein